MQYGANAAEQPRLVGAVGDPAPEPPCHRPARDLRGREGPAGHAEHRQVGFRIPDGDRVKILVPDEPEQRQQPLALVCLFGDDCGVQIRLVKVEPIGSEVSDQISDQERRQRHRGVPLVGIGPDGVPVVVVQEHPRDLSQRIRHPFQLLPGLGAHQDLFLATHRVPHHGTVFAHATHEAVGLAILFYLRERPRGVDGDGDAVGMEQTKRLQAGGRGGWEAEDLFIQHPIDVQDNQRRAPADCRWPPAHPSAEAGGVHGEKVPGIEVEAVELPGAVRETPVGEIRQRHVHRQRSRQEFVEKEPIRHPGVCGFLDIAIDDPSLFRLGQPRIEDGLGEIVGGIRDVQLIFPLAVVLEIRLQQRPGAGDPFLRAQLRINQRGHRTGAAGELMAEARAL